MHLFLHILDPSYSSRLLESAESLYVFAKARQGTYNADISDGAKFYRYEYLIKTFFFPNSVHKYSLEHDFIPLPHVVVW